MSSYNSGRTNSPQDALDEESAVEKTAPFRPIRREGLPSEEPAIARTAPFSPVGARRRKRSVTALLVGLAVLVLLVAVLVSYLLWWSV